MRTLALLAATALVATSALATAVSADAATKHRVHHRAPTCNDKVLCRKVDGLSASMTKNFASLTDTVKAGQAEEADYHTKSLAYSDQMLTSIKAIEAQGGQTHSAILLSFDNKQLAQGEDAGATANQLCVDSGFKAGKPVDVSAKHGMFSSNATYLKSVVCTF